MSDEHLSFDELAELAEGLLARRKAADAQAHLDGCDECAARSAALGQTSAALHDLGPVAMPADVVARLDRALADADAAGGETVVPDLGAVRRRRRAAASWPYAAAASIVAIVAVAVAVTVSNGDDHTASPSAADEAARPLVATTAPRDFVESESGQTYTADTVRSLVPQLLGGAAADSAGSSVAGGTATRSGGAGTSTKIAAPPAPRAQAPMSAQLSTVANVPIPLRRYASSRPALLACAAYITDTPNAAPLAVDYARWTNPKAHLRAAPSLILVFEDPDDASILDVYVVAPACDEASLRDFTEVPKGT